MTFEIDAARYEELLAIEAECNCDISAGRDYGPHLGEWLRHNLQMPSEPNSLEPLSLETQVHQVVPNDDSGMRSGGRWR